VAQAPSRKDVIWQRKDTVASYTQSRPGIPFADDQFDLVFRALRAHEVDVRNILDLGCGDGIAVAELGDRLPIERAVMVDFSEPMLEAAERRFAGSATAITLVHGDLAGSDWLPLVEIHGPFDLVVSRYAIHHLAHDRKRSLYKEIHGLLRPGGMFFNIEHVQSVNRPYQRAFDTMLIDGIHRLADEGKSMDDVERAYHARQDVETNILAPVDLQCDWLREVGFADVDCIFKAFELAVFGGRRVTP
jgi:ubiquinone/menaquinone biosynthesis C-methylase UbiE